MTMTPERLAELDAVMTKVSGEWRVLNEALPHTVGISNTTGEHVSGQFFSRQLNNAAAIVALHNAYPDLRAHIEAQAATIARQAEALREIVASDSPLGRNGVPSHKEIARRALKGIDHE